MDNIFKENLKGKSVLVVGMARSGIAAVDAMLKLGAKVTAQDAKPREKADPALIERLEKEGVLCLFGELPAENAKFDYLLLSPGVNPELDFIQKQVEKGAELMGELETAFRLSQGTFVAITGTNGKTTTTSLTGEIFEKAGLPTYVVGNIGLAVITKALDTKPEDWLITETSSYQLQTVTTYKPRIAAILNITPDHLDRHHSMECYANIKARIGWYQDENDYIVLNYDDPLTRKLIDEQTACESVVSDLDDAGKSAALSCDGVCGKAFDAKPFTSLGVPEKRKFKSRIVPFSRREKLDFGAYLEGDVIVVKDASGIHEICDKHELKIIGDHNVENALAASAIAYFAGIEPEKIAKALGEFGGVEHRMEFVRELDGVRYYNDSKGTNVDATTIALRAIKHDVLLIAGGDAKAQEFDPLLPEFEGVVKHVLLYGRDAHLIQEAMDRASFKEYTYCEDLPDAVKKARDMAVSGDTVLLSPACASWDMYPNFEVRGVHFKDTVRGL